MRCGCRCYLACCSKALRGLLGAAAQQLGAEVSASVSSIRQAQHLAQCLAGRKHQVFRLDLGRWQAADRSTVRVQWVASPLALLACVLAGGPLAPPCITSSVPRESSEYNVGAGERRHKCEGTRKGLLASGGADFDFPRMQQL